MNKFVVLLSLLSLLLSSFAIYSMDGIEKSNAFTAENVERVVNNIPKQYPEYTPPVEQVKLPIKEEVLCLQKNIFFEARNQDEEAQIAVAWVTINRVKSNRYPNKICDVVYQGIHKTNGIPKKHQCKFSWYCDGLPDNPNLRNPIERKAWIFAGEIAEAMVRGCLMKIDYCIPDNTNGALYYHNPTTSMPRWVNTKVKTVRVGDHDFYAAK